jgi:hypothetical protein
MKCSSMKGSSSLGGTKKMTTSKSNRFGTPNTDTGCESSRCTKQERGIMRWEREMKILLSGFWAFKFKYLHNSFMGVIPLTKESYCCHCGVCLC